MRKNDFACLARPLFNDQCLQPSWCQRWVRWLSSVWNFPTFSKNVFGLSPCAAVPPRVLPSCLTPATVFSIAWKSLRRKGRNTYMSEAGCLLARPGLLTWVSPCDTGANGPADNRISMMSDTGAGVMGVKHVSLQRICPRVLRAVLRTMCSLQ